MEIQPAAARGDIEMGGAGVGGDQTAMDLAWQELTVVLPNFGNGPTRRLIHGVSGHMEPGRITAIMGPSGSGKSTLLDALAGRLAGNVVMTGTVLLNGKKSRLDYGAVAYVTQEDVMLGTLTVRETIAYSARLRLPAEQSPAAVESAISEMGLEECADRVIGNWHRRGISGGEKKRLSIALEILAGPRLLFLDEPTTGLDGAAAFFVAHTLRGIARDGRAVMASVHQPSSEVFALFDDLCLLSGGQTVYFGEAKTAVEFFREAGFPCPRRRNPSDHFLRCINSDFDAVANALPGSREAPPDHSPAMTTAEIRDALIQTYNSSKYARRVHARLLPDISDAEGFLTRESDGGRSRWFRQLRILTQRSFLNMCRDLGYYWLRIAIYIGLSFCVGTIFFDVGTSFTAIYARGSCGGFIAGFMTFMSIGGFPSFIEEMKVFQRERLNGHYGVAVFILSNFVSSFPFLVALTASTVGITYSMVKFRPGFTHFLYSFLDLLSCISVVESCMMIIASLVPNFLMGIITGAGFIGIMMMTAGFFRQLPDLPKLFWRYPVSYVNYSAWGLQGAYKNDMVGLEFDPLVPGGPKLKGDFIISAMLGVPLSHSKWWDLAAVVFILVSYRFLFFAILKVKERGSPLVRRLYANTTLRTLEKRPSFRKPSFASNRHQNLYPLSSQEGLNSPIH